jgi:hypothetical protein
MSVDRDLIASRNANGCNVQEWTTGRCENHKAIPVTGRGGPQVSETSSLPHILDNRLTDGGEVVSLTLRPTLLRPGRFLILIPVRG